MIVIVLWVQAVLLLGLITATVVWWRTAWPAGTLVTAGVMAGFAVTDAVNAASWSQWLVSGFTAVTAAAWVVLWRVERRHARRARLVGIDLSGFIVGVPVMGVPVDAESEERLVSLRDTSVTLQGWFTTGRPVGGRALDAWQDTPTPAAEPDGDHDDDTGGGQ